MEANMHWIWLGAMLFFIALEASTNALVALWFIGGSFVAMLLAAFGAPIGAQVVAFVVISAILLLLLRPWMRRFVNAHKTVTNTESNVGKVVLVTEAIDNLHGKGAVRVSGVEWTAVSVDGKPIAVETPVRIVSISGAKLCVEPAETT